jgi:hypothetical protein
LLTESDLTEWTKPLGQSFVVGTGLKSLDPPATIQEFVELVTRDTTRFGQPLPEPKVAEEPNEQSGSETGEDETAPTEAKPTPEPPKAPPAPSENLIKLLEHEPNDSITEFGNIRLSVQYLDDPIIQVGQTNRFVFNFANLGEESQELHTSLSAPEGWESKSHLSSFRLEPGQSSAFPVVVKPTKEPEGRGANLKLRLNKVDVLVPMLVSQRWSWIGPFVNHAGAGYERSFPPETEIDPAAVYNGRSDLPVRWQQESFPGVVFDLDSKFRTGPGVIYLYGRLRFESNETLRMVTASPVGVVVWINGERKLWYHDVHEPVPRSEDRYVTEFAPGEEVTILVKVLRNMQPIGPTTIYFLDQSGKVVLPVEFKSIGE